MTDYSAIKISEAVKRLADTITPNICGGEDAMGGNVESLTEAVMGQTAALKAIAEAIERYTDVYVECNLVE